MALIRMRPDPVERSICFQVNASGLSNALQRYAWVTVELQDHSVVT